MSLRAAQAALKTAETTERSTPDRIKAVLHSSHHGAALHNAAFAAGQKLAMCHHHHVSSLNDAQLTTQVMPCRYMYSVPIARIAPARMR